MLFCCVLFYFALCCCFLDSVQGCSILHELFDVAILLSHSFYFARCCCCVTLFEFALCWPRCFMFPIICSIRLYFALCCFLLLNVFGFDWFPFIMLLCCALFYFALFLLLEFARGCSMLHIMFDVAVCLSHFFYFARCCCFAFLFEFVLCWPCCFIFRSCVLSGFVLLYVARIS